MTHEERTRAYERIRADRHRSPEQAARDAARWLRAELVMGATEGRRDTR